MTWSDPPPTYEDHIIMLYQAIFKTVSKVIYHMETGSAEQAAAHETSSYPPKVVA